MLRLFDLSWGQVRFRVTSTTPTCEYQKKILTDTWGKLEQRGWVLSVKTSRVELLWRIHFLDLSKQMLTGNNWKFWKGYLNWSSQCKCLLQHLFYFFKDKSLKSLVLYNVWCFTHGLSSFTADTKMSVVTQMTVKKVLAGLASYTSLYMRLVAKKAESSSLTQ